MAFDSKKYQREYQRKYRAERKEAGLCAKCGKPSDGKRCCQECRAKDAERQKKRQQDLADRGICKMCGKKKSLEGHLHCANCLAKANKAVRNYIKKNRSEGRCLSCGIKCEKVRCESCNEKSKEKNKRRRKSCSELGLCRDCGKEAITSTRSLRGRDRAGYCEPCYLKMMSRTLLGSGTLWPVLLDKLYRCDWRCHYTGEKLTLGDNLSFDHLDPVCRFPEKKFDVNNIVPCSWQINLMKRDLTKPEFLEMTQKVVLYQRGE